MRSYLVRFLFHAMEQRLHDVPWPSTELYAGEDLAMAVEPIADAIIQRNAELRAAFKEDPSSLSADDRARAEQLLARDARKAAKKAARRVSSETPSPGTA